VYQRKLKGYTQEELSEKTQVTIRTIQRIENGDVNPHLQTIKLLATALDVEIEDLLIIENPKKKLF
jgi:transcriptional regulator with XRE-family HTH domain